MLVGVFGRNVTYRQWVEIGGGYNPMGGSTSGAYQEHTVTAIPFTKWKRKTIDDTSVLAGDLKVSFSPVEVTWIPTLDRDRIVDAFGRVYSVVGVDEISTGDSSALLTLQLRMVKK